LPQPSTSAPAAAAPPAVPEPRTQATWQDSSAQQQADGGQQQGLRPCDHVPGFEPTWGRDAALAPHQYQVSRLAADLDCAYWQAARSAASSSRHSAARSYAGCSRFCHPSAARCRRATSRACTAACPTAPGRPSC
jgi:hypothetical protein